MAPPLLLALLHQCLVAHIAFVRPLLIRKVTQLHGLHDAVDNQGRAEAGSQSQEEHLSSSIAAQPLHGGIIYELYVTAERRPEVKANPTASQIAWFCNWAISQHGPGEADRNCIVFPVPGNLFHARDHLFGRQRGPGRKLPRFSFTADENLDVCPTDINYQHIHAIPSSRTRLAA